MHAGNTCKTNQFTSWAEVIRFSYTHWDTFVSLSDDDHAHAVKIENDSLSTVLYIQFYLSKTY